MRSLHLKGTFIKVDSSQNRERTEVLGGGGSDVRTAALPPILNGPQRGYAKLFQICLPVSGIVDP